jgi:hypothetical protein
MPTWFGDPRWFRRNFNVRPESLVRLSNYISIHIWIVENWVSMRLAHLFYYRLLLESKMDSNLTLIEPPTWLGHPCWPPKVVAKEADVQWLLWCVLHLLGACSNLSQGPKSEYQAHDDDTFLGRKQRQLIMMVWRPCRCDLEIKPDPLESL